MSDNAPKRTWPQADAPKRIWLQMDGPNQYDWTWASHEIGEPDIEEAEYVRADTVAEPTTVARDEQQADGVVEMTEPHKVMDYRERQMHDGQEYKKQENRIRALEKENERLKLEIKLCEHDEAIWENLVSYRSQLATAREVVSDVRDCFHEDSDAYKQLTLALNKLESEA